MSSTGFNNKGNVTSNIWLANALPYGYITKEPGNTPLPKNI